MAAPGVTTAGDSDGCPLHVAIVIHSLHDGGAESVARQWLAELRAAGHRTTVYVYNRQQPHVALAPGVVVHRLPARGGALRPILLLLWLRLRVRRDRPDIVVSMLPYSGVISLAALVLGAHDPVPVMVSEHNVPSLHASNLGRRDRIMYWLARRLYRYAAAVHAVSHPIAGELVSSYRIPPEKIFVVPNPVVPSSMAMDEVRDDPPTHLRLAFVGRFVSQKRPSLFLEVLQELARRGVDVQGVMIGDGPLRHPTETRASELDLDVAFLGWQEPWWDAVSDLDCLVLTANAEGLAMVLVEAAAAGIPAVASSRALGVADAIVPGITGQFALDDSAVTYADAVLAAAPLAPLSDVNLRAWLTHFSPANSAATLVTALRTTIAAARPSPR